MMKITLGRTIVALSASIGLVALPVSAGAAGTTLAQTGPAPVSLASNDPGSLYKDFSKYPPESRPLDPSQWDLLHPGSVESLPLPAVPRQFARQLEAQRGSVDMERIGEQLSPTLPRYQFTLDRSVLAGVGDELVARLTVMNGLISSAGVPLPSSALRFGIAKTELVGDPVFGSPSLGAVPFTCEAGGTACTLRWKIPSADPKYWGQLGLLVTATVEGLPDAFELRQVFYSSPMTAGAFTGGFRERLVNGSLVVDAAVDVRKRMACFVSANLYSIATGLPVQRVERRLIVDPSVKTISFTFFGKIFRDYNQEGAFRVQDLTGQCENLSYPPEWFMDSYAHQADLAKLQTRPQATTEPSRIYFAHNDYRYTTASYLNSVFSDLEWQSQDRGRKLGAYAASAKELDSPAMAARKRDLQLQLRGN